MADTFNITIKQDFPEKKAVLFALEGALQANTLSIFKEKINSVINDGKCNIILDCEKLSFASSAALGALMGILDRVEALDGKVIILNLSEAVAEVFELLDFYELFPVCKTVEEALSKI